MSGITTSGRALLTAIGLSTALALAGCGGSSPSAPSAATTTSTHSSSSTAVAQHSDTTTSDATTSDTSGRASRPQASARAKRSVENTRSSSGTETTSTTSTKATSSVTAADTARLKAAFTKAAMTYVGCLREHGVKVPEPHASANGPVFDTKHLNTSSPAFKQASLACRSVTIAALRAAEKK
jgi:hypothetical protein